MRVSKKKKGFSIVEEMAAIAIMILVATACLSFLLTSTKLIARGGKITKNISNAQNAIGNKIQSGSAISNAVTPQTITLEPFQGSTLVMTPVSGNTVTYVNDSNSKNKVSLSTFLPN